MALFEHYSPQARKRIAFIGTAIIAVLLLAVLVLVYTGKKKESEAAPTAPFGDFYDTLSEQTQSFFNGN